MLKLGGHIAHNYACVQLQTPVQCATECSLQYSTVIARTKHKRMFYGRGCMPSNFIIADDCLIF